MPQPDDLPDGRLWYKGYTRPQSLTEREEERYAEIAKDVALGLRPHFRRVGDPPLDEPPHKRRCFNGLKFDLEQPHPTWQSDMVKAYSQLCFEMQEELFAQRVPPMAWPQATLTKSCTAWYSVTFLGVEVEVHIKRKLYHVPGLALQRLACSNPTTPRWHGITFDWLHFGGPCCAWDAVTEFLHKGFVPKEEVPGSSHRS